MKKVNDLLRIALASLIFITIGALTSKAQCIWVVESVVDCPLDITFELHCPGGVEFMGPFTITEGTWSSSVTTPVELPPHFCNLQSGCILSIFINGLPVPGTMEICCGGGTPSCVTDACGEVTFDPGNKKITLSKPVRCP